MMIMMNSATIFLLAMAGSASANDSFNVKLKFLREGVDLNYFRGTFVPATDDNLGSSCDPFEDEACTSFKCEQFDRSLDVFSDYFEVEGLNDVSIETSAPYALYVDEYNDITLFVGETGFMYTDSGFCTGYNGFQSTWCTSLPNIPPSIESRFWSGGANPGTGNTGWGSCRKCPDNCYTTTDLYGDNSCDFVCDDSFGTGSWDFPDFSEGTNAKSGMVAGLLGLALTSLVMFAGA